MTDTETNKKITELYRLLSARDRDVGRQHVRLDRDRVWINLGTVAAIVATVIYLVSQYNGDTSRFERQYRELSSAIGQLVESIEGLERGTANRYTSERAMYDCLVYEQANPGWHCPYRRQSDQYTFIKRSE